MAKLNLPQEQPVGGLQKLDPSIGQQAAASGAAIGKVAQNFGADLVRESQQYFNQARDAIDNSLATTAYSKASIEYADAINNRMMQQTDENGMPTFESLGDDIAKIGDDIGSKYGSMLVSPGAASRFNESFKGLRTQHEISALSAARQQQMDFGRASLNQGIDTTTNNAIGGDPSQTNFHVTNGNRMIDEAVRGGLITAQEAQKLKEGMHKGIVSGQAFIANSQNPEAVKAELDKGNTFGLDPVELQKFKNDNANAIRVKTERAQKLQKEKESMLAKQQLAIQKELELGMVQGTVGPNEIEQAYANGQVSHNQRTDMLISWEKSRASGNNKQQVRNEITANINAKDPLNEFTSEQINDHYRNAVAVGSLDQNGQPTKKLTLLDKAEIASTYLAPVTDLGKEINTAILSGSDQDVIQAVSAMDALEKKNPVAISQGVSSQGMAIAAIVSMNRYTNTPIERIVKEAREQVLNKDQSVYELRDKTFTQVENFKPENIDKTILDATDPGVFVSQADKLDSEYKPILYGLLREGFKQTGSEAGALAYFKKSTSSTFGISHFNQKQSLGFAASGDSEFTYLPVEQQYPQYSVETMKANLQTEAIELAKTYGINPDQIRIKAGINADPTPGKTKYDLSWVDEDGIEHPIADANGQQAQWSPDMESLDAAKQTAFIEGQYLQKDLDSGGLLGAGVNWLKRNFPVVSKPETSQVKNIAAAIASVETPGSANPYKELGGVLPSGQYKGQRALGKYQIMPGNLPAWSKEAVGRVVSPSEFMNNPALQDQIAEYQMGKLYKKYGNPQDVMSVWLTGRPLSKGGSAKDLVTGISGNQYVDRAMKHYNSLGKEADTGDPMQAYDLKTKEESSGFISIPKILDSIGTSIGKMLFSSTSAMSGVSYGWGSKNPRSGSVDCSGLVGYQTLQVMGEMNKMGANYDLNYMKKIMNQPAAMQVALVGAKAGFISRADLENGAVHSGTIIGIRRQKVEDFAKNRPFGISHVVQVVEKDGKKYISESARSKGGVALTPYDKWIAANKGSTLYATNPFSLMRIQ